MIMGEKVVKFIEKEDSYCLKGICMLMIIIGHTYNGFPLDNADFHFPKFLYLLHIGLWGELGVAVFFFLSGFGLFFSLNRHKIDGHYLVSKARRLLVPLVLYWIVELVTLAVFAPEDFSWHLFREIVTLSIHPNIENWFFKIIVAAYILCVLIFAAFKQDKVRLAIVFAITISYFGMALCLQFGEWWYNTILCFPLGMLVAREKDFFRRMNPWAVVLCGAVISIILAATNLSRPLLSLVFSFSAVYFINVVNIKARILRFIGFNSLVFYFMECPAMDEIAMFSYNCFPLYCLLSLVITFVISLACVKISQRKFKVQE